MITVKATREGLVGQKTASGYIIDTVVPFVALPARAALNCWVRLYNPANGKSCRALVLDIGPWNTADHAYVFQPATTDKIGLSMGTPGTSQDKRPQSESGQSLSGKGTNGAGIDLGEAVWQALGMVDNANISWEFD